jgi:branched-chain amino acid transport system permease protein
VFLGGYLSYQMATVWKMDPLLALLVVPPLFFFIGVAMQWVLSRFEISPFNSLLVTFGITVVIESGIQGVWTADYRRLESHYNAMKFMVGKLYVPVPELLTLVLALALSSACGRRCATRTWARRCARWRRTGRSRPPSASTRSSLALLLAGGCAALAGVAGVCLALTFTLAPSQIFAWVGVVFAAVMLGGLGSALGPLVAGVIIGVSEAVTMAVASPSWAPIVSFSLLIVMLLFRPGRPEKNMNKRSIGILAAGRCWPPACPGWACPRSTNPSCTWCATGRCWRCRGTSSPATRATSRSATAPSSASACMRRPCWPAS